MLRQKRRTAEKRDGAVTVEFAVLAPVFIMIVLGTAEISRLLDMQHTLAIAVRSGARLASMDATQILVEGQTVNQKISQDLKTFLSSNGLPGDQAVITITDPTSGEPMELSDPASKSKLFRLRVTIPYDAVHGSSIPGTDVFDLSAEIVFRNR